ncbi:MAG TPA: hypothetical protein PLR18_02205 [bacterium]|nr:hypothetical protein [bacterium]
MLQDDLQNGIVVKTKDGFFKLLKNGQLEELPSDDLVIQHNEVLAVKQEPEIKNETPAEKRATAGFYFTVDDEKDIRKLRNDDAEEKNKRIKEFIDRTVESIIRVAEEAGIITLPGQSEPVKKIIFSRLKDIRSLSETKEALASPLIMRNKPLGKKEIELLLTLVEKQRPKIDEAVRTGKTTTIEMKAEALKKEPVMDSTPAVEIEPKKRDLGVQYGEESSGGQHYRSIITGPVEEIKNLSLTDFRKLGANPLEAVGRIWEKINLLEDESLIKRDEGVRAWRQSETGRLYLAMGAESMAEKKTVEQVFMSRKAAGKPFLIPEEFNAIADLNRKLTY